MSIESLAVLVENSKTWPLSERDKVSKNPLWIEICQTFNGWDGYYQRACSPCGNSRGIECAADNMFSVCSDNIKSAIELIPDDNLILELRLVQNHKLPWVAHITPQERTGSWYGAASSAPKAILAALIRMKGVSND